MNLKISFLLLLCSLFFNCDVKFDNDVRIEVSGKIIDESSEPMANINVGVYTSSGRLSGFFPLEIGRNQLLLGRGNSNEFGDFSVTSLFDSNQDFFIFIDGKNEYTDYIYSENTFGYTPDDYLYNLEEVQLKKRAAVNVNITRTSPAGTILDFTITYQTPFCEEIFINGVLDNESSFCFKPDNFFSTLNDDNPNFAYSFDSFKTGIVQLTYTINNGVQTNETFTISEEDYNINFNY